MTLVRRRWFVACVLAVLMLAAFAPAVSARWPSNLLVEVQILATNDMHGHIAVDQDIDGRALGGAAYLAGYIERERAENPHNTLLVDAGDEIGASPPVSALLQDKPTLSIMNAMGYDVASVGNHEFDKGVDALLQLYQGDCGAGAEPPAGCFPGSAFPHLAANVVWKASGEPILPPYQVFRMSGVPIGFIGVVTSETPSIVIPSGVAEVAFLDEAETVNRYVPELLAQGVRTIIVLIHEGGVPDGPNGAVTGRIVEIANEISDDVDVIVSGHTHQGYVTEIDGKLVTQSWYYTRALTDIELRINRITGEVVSRSAELMLTWDDEVTPDPHIAAMVAEYEAEVAPLINREVGVAATDITRANTAGTGETALGNLITDAQRWKVGVEFALTNPGGIREDIDAGPVTWGDLFTVQPFGNDLVMLDLSGAQLYALLEQQWQENQTRFLQISGFEYDYDPTRPAGSRIIEIRDGAGAPLDRQASYRVVANAYLAGGGDSFTVMNEGTNREIGPNELDALVEYIEQLPQPFTATIEGRIRTVQ